MAYDFVKESASLYWDESLTGLKNYNGRQVDYAVDKSIKKYGLNSKAKSNLKTVNFLDVAFNLN